MPIKRKKNKEFLLDKFRLDTKDRKHYVNVFVWENRPAMIANTIGMTMGTAACHAPNVYYVNVDTGDKLIPPLLGELHFTIDFWSTEIVSHEVMHVILNYIRNMTPDEIVALLTNDDIDIEEDLCYEFGRWCYQVHKRLYILHEENTARLGLAA